MAFDPAFLELMPVTVKVSPFTGYSTDGNLTPQYGSEQSIRARIEIGAAGLTSVEVRELRAVGKVFLASITIFDKRSKLELPAGHDPLTPPIVQVRPQYDEAGVHHVELLVGTGVDVSQ